MLKKLLVGVAFGALAGGAASAATWEEINNAGSQSRDWLVYGGDLGQMRYLPSDQINTDNVKNLKLKYIFQTGVVGSFENTPIVEGGVLYVTSPYNHLFAVDAATGNQLWHYEHKLATTVFCCGPNSRGVVVHGDLVIMPTLDAMLVALNKKTGELVWETEVADPGAGLLADPGADRVPGQAPDRHLRRRVRHPRLRRRLQRRRRQGSLALAHHSLARRRGA